MFTSYIYTNYKYKIWLFAFIIMFFYRFLCVVLLVTFLSLMLVGFANITPSLLLHPTFGQLVSRFSTSITNENFHHCVLFVWLGRYFFCFFKASHCNLKFAEGQRLVFLCYYCWKWFEACLRSPFRIIAIIKLSLIVSPAAFSEAVQFLPWGRNQWCFRR